MLTGLLLFCLLPVAASISVLRSLCSCDVVFRHRSAVSYRGGAITMLTGLLLFCLLPVAASIACVILVVRQHDDSPSHGHYHGRR